MYKDLYRYCKPVIVNRVVEHFLINGELSTLFATDRYEKTIDSNIPPIAKWEGFLSNMGFSCVSRFERRYSFWHLAFEFPETFSRHATINVSYSDNYVTGKISHIISCIYQGTSIRILSGNIDEFYEKISKNLELFMEVNKIVNEEKITFEILVNASFDKQKAISTLIEMAKNKKLTWKAVSVILPEDLAHKYLGKIAGEKYNLQ